MGAEKKGHGVSCNSKPSPGPDEVLAPARANSLNRSHLMILKCASHGGLWGSGLPLGLEWIGEVVEVGVEARCLREILRKYESPNG